MKYLILKLHKLWPRGFSATLPQYDKQITQNNSCENKFYYDVTVVGSKRYFPFLSWSYKRALVGNKYYNNK